MLICCVSAWRRHQPGDREIFGDTTFLMDRYDARADLVLDMKFPCTELSRRFPPERRAWMHLEPEVFTDYFDGFEQYYGAAIFSWHTRLEALPQFRAYRQGGLIATPRTTTTDKRFGIGGFISAKNNPGMDGYALRREILARQADIAIPSLVYNHTGRWLDSSHDYPRPGKDEVMDLMFHFAIENCRERHYFSEKLMDCFATMTVPLYFGDPRIDEAFDTRGMILLDPESWLEQVNQLTPEDYHRRHKYLARNYERSRPFWTKLDRIAVAARGIVP